ncbi:DUF4111 domain-containing protein [Halobacillus rhizosphaerae]|uniref:aminoglycoside adenylyltransferase domain-containing protein n=1 Tax=Halobacillus rhizosphaerae TaxID=3064889 RepID=UPI00398ACF21
MNINQYVHKLVQTLEPSPFGIYQYGSGAIGAFNKEQSDWDLIIFFHSEDDLLQLTPQIQMFHDTIRHTYPEFYHRLDVMFLPISAHGKGNGDVSPYPSLEGGSFASASYHNLNAVTWWTLRTSWYGPELLPAVTMDDVMEEMKYNLTHYWPHYIAKGQQADADGEEIVWVVSGLARILYTVECHDIIGKESALDWARKMMPEHQEIIDEAIQLRRGKKSFVLADSAMKAQVLQFADQAIELGQRKLNL